MPNQQLFELGILAAGAWLFAATGFAILSGWVFLARRFRARSRPQGHVVKGQVRRMGGVSGRLAQMIVSHDGLYLYASIPFRAVYPALLIPWSQVRLRRKVKVLRWHLYEVEIGGLTDLRVTEEAYEHLRSYQRARKRGRRTAGSPLRRYAGSQR